MAAAGLGVELEELNFSDLRYFQGVEVPLVKEFSSGSIDLRFARGGERLIYFRVFYFFFFRCLVLLYGRFSRVCVGFWLYLGAYI